jgi:hypothetical protein
MPITIAATGHRPDKLVNQYDEASLARLTEFAATCLKQLAPDFVISGMALGWDQAIAEAAVSLDIPLIAEIPFPGQPSRWPVVSIVKWHWLKSKAYHVK